VDEPGATAPGAFDGATDFARHDVIALARRHGRAPWAAPSYGWTAHARPVPLRRRDLRGGAAHPHPPLAGGHDGGYWRAHYAAYLHFYASALAGC